MATQEYQINLWSLCKELWAASLFYSFPISIWDHCPVRSWFSKTLLNVCAGCQEISISAQFSCFGLSSTSSLINLNKNLRGNFGQLNKVTGIIISFIGDGSISDPGFKLFRTHVPRQYCTFDIRLLTDIMTQIQLSYCPFCNCSQIMSYNGCRPNDTSPSIM